MKKASLLKISGVALTALLLIGAGGCNKSSDTTSTGTTPTESSQTTPSVVTGTPETPVGTQVMISDNGFEPQKVTVKIGDKVTWNNTSTKTVRVASDPHPIHNGLPGFDDLNGSKPGEIYTYTFTKAGTFGYHDHNNPSVKGTVVVTQ